MARKRSPAFDYAVYVVVRLVVAVVQMLPRPWAMKAADALAWLAYRVDRRHRLVADDNLRHAFGDRYTAEERDQIVRRVYRHFCRMLVEIVQLPRRLKAGTVQRIVDFSAAKGFLEAALSERVPMVVTGHFGNWEVAGFHLGLVGCKTYPIARPLDNPYVDRWLRDFRERTGQEVLTKNDDYERIQDVLQSGGVVATLCDQDAGQRGQFVEFFGRPASTHKAIALFSLEYDVPLLVVAMVVVPETDGFKVLIGDYIDPRDYAGRPDAVPAITQRFTTALERLVREHPEQYFWLHRRWKSQPKARVKRQAA